MAASQNGHVEVVDKLLQHGATVDLQDKDGDSSLMAASQEGHVEVVDQLLQHGATVDLQRSVITTHTVLLNISDDRFPVLNLSVTLGSSFVNRPLFSFVIRMCTRLPRKKRNGNKAV
ncbi:Ankyrin repeat domain-containing protein 29, partial [Geodia barretti]